MSETQTQPTYLSEHNRLYDARSSLRDRFDIEAELTKKLAVMDDMDDDFVMPQEFFQLGAGQGVIDFNATYTIEEPLVKFLAVKPGYRPRDPFSRESYLALLQDGINLTKYGGPNAILPDGCDKDDVINAIAFINGREFILELLNRNATDQLRVDLAG